MCTIFLRTVSPLGCWHNSNLAYDNSENYFRRFFLTAAHEHTKFTDMWEDEYSSNEQKKYYEKVKKYTIQWRHDGRKEKTLIFTDVFFFLRGKETANKHRNEIVNENENHKFVVSKWTSSNLFVCLFFDLAHSFNYFIRLLLFFTLELRTSSALIRHGY